MSKENSSSKTAIKKKYRAFVPRVGKAEKAAGRQRESSKENEVKVKKCQQKTHNTVVAYSVSLPSFAYANYLKSERSLIKGGKCIFWDG